MNNITTLRPGLLVSLKTALSGNVHYKTRDIETDHIAQDGTRRATWETNRTIEDPGEHERGVKARSKARSLVVAVCSESTFGLLCPEADREALSRAVDEAREIANEYNATAAITRLQVNVIVGRVAADDVEAVRAINSEVRELLYSMERGLKNLDVQAVRDAANKAKSLSAMLSPVASEKAEAAIRVARSAARQIVKAGETGAVAIDEATIAVIRNSRTAFLDLDDAAEFQAPTATARAVDFDMDTLPLDLPAAPVPATVQLEL